MKASIKKIWLKALRSGDYKQGKGWLKQATDSKTYSYCCLGVLKDAVPGLRRATREEVLAPSALKKVGLTQAEQTKLADMNDAGKSFKTIAAYISRFLVIFMVLAPWGCASLLGPVDPEIPGARLIQPDSIMTYQYHRAERCTGMYGNISKVTWYLVPGRSFKSPENGADDIGWANREMHKIYIAEDWKNFGWVWRHEAIHEITGMTGHPEVPFGYPCHALFGYLLQDGGDSP